MLNAILKTLNGHGSETASLEAALLQLGRDRDETRAKIDALQKQRHAALLDDASDADLDKLERQIDRAEVRLEKFNAAEPELLERLTAARSAARQRRWRELRDAYASAAGEFLVAARVTLEKHSTLVATIEQARREGFEAEANATMPATPNINGSPLLAPDLLDIFERAVTPPAAPVRRPAKAEPPAVPDIWNDKHPGYHHPTAQNLRTILPRPPGRSTQHGIELHGGVPIPAEDLSAKRDADDLAPLRSRDEVRARVLRPGYSPSDDRPQCHYGQIIRLSKKVAEAAAAGGVVEIIEHLVPRESAGASDQPDVTAIP